MTEYQFIEDGSVIRIADYVTIPNDPENRDWQAFEKWVAEGNVADEAVPLVSALLSAPKLGLIHALREINLWSQVKAAIAADETMQEDWDAAQNITATNPLTKKIIDIFDLSAQDVSRLIQRANDLV